MKVTVIGFGKLGKALAMKLGEKGSLFAVVSKHYKNLPKEKGILDGKVPILSSINELDEVSDVVFITTSDNKIDQIAEEIHSHFGNKVEGKIFIHCSGIYSDKILTNLEQSGGITASAHPLQTFYEYIPNIFDNIYWIVQSKYFPIIKDIVEAVGGTAIEVHFDEQTRAIYHASAVVASNYLNSLLLLAKKLITLSHLEPSVLIPLIFRTLQNNLTKFNEPEFTPQTGPIVRGDFETIVRHIESLQQHKELKEVYSILSLGITRLALMNNDISLEISATLESILKEHIN